MGKLVFAPIASGNFGVAAFEAFQGKWTAAAGYFCMATALAVMGWSLEP